MRGKIFFVAGAAVGYILGARAGRKRYDQIAAAASKVWQSDPIQKQVQLAEDYAADRLGAAPGAVFDGVKKLVSSAGKSSTTRATPAKPAAKKTSTAKKPASSTKAASSSEAAPETDD